MYVAQMIYHIIKSGCGLSDMFDHICVIKLVVLGFISNHYSV